MEYRHLTKTEISDLINEGSLSTDWTRVMVAVEGFSTKNISRVRFSGDIRLGCVGQNINLACGECVESGIYDATLHNCNVGNGCYIAHVARRIANYSIGDGVFIENIGSLEVSGLTAFGNDTLAAVLNESGGIEIPVFEGLSSHLAYMLATRHDDEAFTTAVRHSAKQFAESRTSSVGHIGHRSAITDCTRLHNVSIGEYAVVEGAAIIEECTLCSTAQSRVVIGSGVNIRHSIVCGDTQIDESALLNRCFVGQGCRLGKNYSATDTLFFANCQGMHGEAASVFAGPYTVSHHKSTLLIAGMFAFLNAGSGSNQSNHLYKSGPVHYGIAERGSKTTSDSYILWPAHVGAFSLVMGRHITHPDTTDMPFSYLIENSGQTFLVPAVNLRSIGTVRDIRKWRSRDIRHGKVSDHIIFKLLNPYTIQQILRGHGQLAQLLSTSGRCDTYGYRGCAIRYGALLRGLDLYDTAVVKFLGGALVSRLGESVYSSVDALRGRLSPTCDTGQGVWTDLAGLTVPESEVEMLAARVSSGMTTADAERSFEAMYCSYAEWEWNYASQLLAERIGKPLGEVTTDDIAAFITEWTARVAKLDEMLICDALKEEQLDSPDGRQPSAEALVESVRDHTRRKRHEGESLIRRLPKK